MMKTEQEIIEDIFEILQDSFSGYYADDYLRLLAEKIYETVKKGLEE